MTWDCRRARRKYFIVGSIHLEGNSRYDLGKLMIFCVMMERAWVRFFFPTPYSGMQMSYHAEFITDEESSGNSMDVGLNPRFNKPMWIETLLVRILFSLVKHYVFV
jgi:hypothetical protein